MTENDTATVSRFDRAGRCKLTTAEEQLIQDCYNSGYSYRDITKKYGFSSGTIARLVKGTRSLSDAQKLSIDKGRRKLTESGRQALSASGKKSCQRSGKIYTKPEQEFKVILNSIGIGVQFPTELKETLNISDDMDAGYSRFVCFQYPLQRYVLDFVDVDNKIAINVNGDYWHANPVLYSHDKLGKLQMHNVKTDTNKRLFLEKHGWKVLDIWESEVKWNIDLVLDKLRAAGIMEARRAYIAEDRVRFPSRLPDWSDRLRELWYKRHPSASTGDDTSSSGKPEAVDRCRICNHCGKEFVYRSSRVQKYCSVDCVSGSQRRLSASDDELLSKLRELGSYTKVGEHFGVSGNAVKKRCSKLGLLHEATKIVRASMSDRARQACLTNPEQIKKAIKESARVHKEMVPYFVATALDSGEELYRFSTYEDLETAGFSAKMVLRVCSGARKTYRGMQWHRENK